MLTRNASDVESDAEAALKRAKLNRSDINRPGFTRKMVKPKSKKDKLSWEYFTPAGKLVTDNDTIDCFNKMVIPPAWEDVWLSPDRRGHLQATGRDTKGRVQYRYHDDWTAIKSVMKFDGLVRFGEKLPKIRQRVDSDLQLPYKKRSKMGLHRVSAVVVHLMDTVHIRVGSDEYAKKNKSYGLTTLKEGHFKRIKGEKAEGRHDAHFLFDGKSGKTWDLIVEDDDVVDLIQASRLVGGADKNQDLFRYETDAGGDADLKAEHINQYIQDATGLGFTAKDFRTWAATWKTGSRFAALLGGVDEDWINGLKKNDALKKLFAKGLDLSTEKSRQTAMLSIIDTVSGDLGNTRAVCRSSYIHPSFLDDWMDTSFDDKWSAAAKKKKINGLNRDESSTIHYLLDS